MPDADHRPRGLSRDAIKLLAMLAMFLNHFAHIFVPAGIAHDILSYIGWFTAPAMAYFLVEGYGRTRDRRMYLARLAGTGAVSQFFYHAALGERNLNMMFTLALCLCILQCLGNVRNVPLRWLCVSFLACLTVATDWPILMAVFTVLVYYGDRAGRRAVLFASYIACYLIYVLFSGPYGPGGMDTITACLSGLGILAVGVMISFMYGHRRMDASENMRKCLQAFFYAFYPAHLALLWICRIALGAG